MPSLASGFSPGGPLSPIQLSEKDTASKVDTLCRLHLFTMALAVAGAAAYGRDALADISRAHGDHLYGRGDFDGAVAQYVLTIGFVEPSYVIRRFLDSARVGNLAAFLEALHAAGVAGSDHTTLLLNCYTKQGARDKLRAFIRGGRGAPSKAGGEGKEVEAAFDVRVAIAVLRDAGCMEEATWLAETHGEHDLYLTLLLLPPGGAGGGGAPALAPSPLVPSPAGTAAALSFLHRLPFLDGEYYARRYGRLLLAGAEGPAVALFISLCVRWERARPYVTGSAERPGGLATLASLGLGPGGGRGAAGGLQRERLRCEDPTTLLALFADHPAALKRFVEGVAVRAATGDAAPLTPPMWHALLEVCLSRDVYVAEDGPMSDAVLARAQEEAVCGGVLRNPSACYDPSTALVLCQAARYRPGSLVLYERTGMRPLVLGHFMEAAEAARASGKHAESKAARRELVRRVKAMSEPGSGEVLGPSAGASRALPLTGDDASVEAAGLWISVLRYLSRSYLDAQGAAVLPAAGAGFGLAPGAPVPGDEEGTVRVCYPGLTGPVLVREREEQESLLSDVLRHLEKETGPGGALVGALPPLTILSVLAECPHLPFGRVRDFMVRRLGGEATAAAEERRQLVGLRADTDALQAEVKRLSTSSVVFQARSCRLCGLELDLPSIHFLCGGGPQLSRGGGGREDEGRGRAGEEHTFHLHCVTEALSSNLGLGGGEGSDLECPLCAQEQRHVRAVVAGLGPKPGLQEQFYSALEASSDGYLKAVEFLGRGLLK